MTTHGAALPPPDLPLEVDVIAHRYGAAVRTRGATSLGVGWSTTDAQMLRLLVLCDLLEGADPAVPVSVHDLGCGWGALWGLLRERATPPIHRYTGYDITPEMIQAARRAYPAGGADGGQARFILSAHAQEDADYGFVSGTYNFTDGTDAAVWEPYVEESLRHFLSRSRKGVAFNLLHQRRCTTRPMYYADPDRWLGWLRAEVAPRGGQVWCRDDYLDDDFTLFVRFPGEGR